MASSFNAYLDGEDPHNLEAMKKELLLGAGGVVIEKRIECNLDACTIKAKMSDGHNLKWAFVFSYSFTDSCVDPKIGKVMLLM